MSSVLHCVLFFIDGHKPRMQVWIMSAIIDLGCLNPSLELHI